MRKFLNSLLETTEFLLNRYLDNFNRIFNPPTEYEEMIMGFTKEDSINFDKAIDMLKSGNYTEVKVKLSNGREITLSVNIWGRKEREGKI